MVDDPRADPPFRDNARSLQPGQMAGNVGLADGREAVEFIDALITAAEGVDHLDSDGVSESFEDAGFGPGLSKCHRTTICAYAHKYKE